MASTDLSPRRIALEEQHADERRVALERLQAEAETAELARAHEIMAQTNALKTVFEQMRMPLEDARLAGKASVLAARRLGSLLEALSPKARRGGPSDRGLAIRDLGIRSATAASVRRLSRVPDPDFQRYIQRADLIPTVTGALVDAGDSRAVAHDQRGRKGTGSYWTEKKRRRIGVKSPSNPSLDEAYSLLIKLLGHLCEVSGKPGNTKRRAALLAAVDLGYQMEDLLKPYRAGY